MGAAALLWLFVRFVRRLGKKAKLERTPRGWLLAALAAAVAAFAESMLTYDALSFVQVTFLLFIFLGLVAPRTRFPTTSRSWEKRDALAPFLGAHQPG